MDFVIIAMMFMGVALVVGMVVLTVFLVKNKLSGGKKTDYVTPDVPEVKKNEVHIKDFMDISQGNKQRVLQFDESFEEDVHTVGAIFNNNASYNKADSQGSSVKSDNAVNMGRGRQDSAHSESRQAAGRVNQFAINDDDYRTVSLDGEDNYPGDETASLVSDNQMKAENAIKVVLKYKDGDVNKVIKMISSKITVGRGVGNDLLLSRDSFTSRNHAVFTIRNNKLYVQDLNSKNGTFIDGNVRVEGEKAIDKSCKVVFGDAVVYVDIN